MQIGKWKLPNRVFVAPMAGVTDRPYRILCKQLGAGYAVSEMAASNPELWDSVKTARRLNHDGEPDPIAVQLSGSDPEIMAQAAVFNIKKGAQIIDINMGCPAKKVCKVASGSALMKDEDLVFEILSAVVQACKPYGIPVTLKTRTGWDHNSRNVLQIATMAEKIGIEALCIHGRTRCDFYKGQAEYDHIKLVKQSISIPVIANGDINSPEKAEQVLEYTQADAVMIGRAAQGRPWIFEQTEHYLEFGTRLLPPSYGKLRKLLLEHLQDHYSFYGEFTGVRTARKHIAWYLNSMPDAHIWLPKINQISETALQHQLLDEWLSSYPSQDIFLAGDTHQAMVA